MAAVHNSAPPRESVRDVLGDLLPAVLDRGLSALPRAKLQLLLHQPHYLLDLQEIVLFEGGEHWDLLPRPPELTERVRAGRDRVEKALFGRMAEPFDGSQVAPIQRKWKYRTVWAIAATAVIVFVATYAATRMLAPPTTRDESSGWAKADSLPKDLNGRQYLNRLAEEADKLINTNRDKRTAPAVAKLILAYRQGCSSLILNDHLQLTAADGAWLKKQCFKWKQEFDEELRRLEETRDAEAALAATEATVRRLSKSLRERAASA